MAPTGHGAAGGRTRLASGLRAAAQSRCPGGDGRLHRRTRHLRWLHGAAAEPAGDRAAGVAAQALAGDGRDHYHRYGLAARRRPAVDGLRDRRSALGVLPAGGTLPTAGVAAAVPTVSAERIVSVRWAARATSAVACWCWSWRSWRSGMLALAVKRSPNATRPACRRRGQARPGRPGRARPHRPRAARRRRPPHVHDRHPGRHRPPGPRLACPSRAASGSRSSARPPATR